MERSRRRRHHLARVRHDLDRHAEWLPLMRCMLYVYGAGSSVQAFPSKHHVGTELAWLEIHTCMLNKRKHDGRATTFVRWRTLSISQRFETNSIGCLIVGNCTLFSHCTWLKWQVFGCLIPNSVVFRRTKLWCRAIHGSDCLKNVTSIDADDLEGVSPKEVFDGIGLAYIERSPEPAKRIPASTKQRGGTANDAWFLTNPDNRARVQGYEWIAKQRDRHPDARPPAMPSSSLQTGSQG